MLITDILFIKHIVFTTYHKCSCCCLPISYLLRGLLHRSIPIVLYRHSISVLPVANVKMQAHSLFYKLLFVLLVYLHLQMNMEEILKFGGNF